MIYIVMGISGSGKSTIGEMLAGRLGLPFYDADDYHLPLSVEKMRNGIPLTDDDRMPWLENLARHVAQWESTGGAVLACSALKERYRVLLQTVPQIIWIYLTGPRDIILERLQSRKAHYMSPALIDSQLEALEEPAYGLHVDITATPQAIVDHVLGRLRQMAPDSAFGVIGLGVMGRNLALNLAKKDTTVSVYNRHVPGKEEGVAMQFLAENPGVESLRGYDRLDEFVQSLRRPRKILMMIYAGATDRQIDELAPLLEPGDVLIDGGNAHYKDTARRWEQLAEAGIHYVGAGISGGEEGARHGPSLMPGGSRQGYDLISPYLEMLAAKDRSGNACVTWIGPGGAGHFVKMVHNSIEYAEMQLLSEVYCLLRYYAGMEPSEVAQQLSEWQRGGMAGYLLEITIDILQKTEGGELLLDKIKDKAGQKGTGRWSVAEALEYGVPYGPLAEAVMARSLSALKDERVAASVLYGSRPQANVADRAAFTEKLKNAFQAARIINHEIGFNLLKSVGKEHGWNLNLSEIARVWTSGCIIRSALMEELAEMFKTEESLLTSVHFVENMKGWARDLAGVAGQGLQSGIALPVLSSALNYFLGYTTANSAANLIQAQRDYFGAHTYQRVDDPSDQYFHTDWKGASI